MWQITTFKIYTCLVNRGVNSNCNTVITAILFEWFSALNHVFHADIFCTFSKIGMYSLLYILTYSI